MSKDAAQQTGLIRKIRRLPPDKLAEVEDFVDFLEHREDRRLVHAASRLSQKSFSKVWDNPDDAAYDQL
jgi:hypothetical protein